ncbi:MAG: aldo/keto reductase [Lachnospiraceae bacterium]|nr:aldo/keto reductase [Lachnospiraceae bacterium]
MESISLSNGKNIPKVMLGSFQMNKESDMEAVVEEAISKGVYGFDTSPSYKTEESLARAVHKALSKHTDVKREDLFIGSKIDSWMMMEGKGDIRKYVEDVLERTKLSYLDLLLIHWPQPEYLVQTYLCMEKLYEEGMVKSIGVCNLKVRHFNKLIEGGATITPHVAQNEIHPFNTEEELVSYCKEKNIVVQAYSPLCRMIPEIKNDATLNILAIKYGVSVAQLMLRFHTQRGLVPIVKTSSPKRVSENTDIFNFTIEEDDMKTISLLDRHFKMFLESRCCPGY